MTAIISCILDVNNGGGPWMVGVSDVGFIPKNFSPASVIMCSRFRLCESGLTLDEKSIPAEMGIKTDASRAC